MPVLLFLPLAVLSAIATSYYGHRWLKTPLVLNILGAVCSFLSVLCLGGAFIPRIGAWARMQDPAADPPLMLALKFLVMTVIVCVAGYLVRSVVLKTGRLNNDGDEV